MTAELKRARREHAGNSVDEIFHEATSSESAGQGNLAMSFGLSDHAPTAIRRSQKVVATISSPKSGGPASAGHPTWLPPDVDEKVPAVEETACSVHEIVQKAEERVLEFVRNVDRFTATESLTHQSINKHGQASTPVGRKFDYVVSIHEVRQGHLGVTEYRNGGLALNEFPGGIATNGLPALTSPSTS